MMKNKKYVLGILAVAILISEVVGCVYCEQESETGIEWFQTGNTQPIIQIQPKQSKELEDNRIGTFFNDLWNLQPEAFPDGVLDASHILALGVKRVRFAINSLGIDEGVNWDKPELSIDTSHDDFITSLADNGVTMTYVLSFWDKEYVAQGGEVQCPRFKTEDEIQRYLDFVQFIVHHFKDRIQYYEIWNEPEFSDPAGDYTIQSIEVVDYINLVKRAVPIIKEEYPEAKIVVGDTGYLFFPETHDYLFSILRSDIMPLVDVIEWHAMFGTSPEYDEEYYYNYPSLVQEIKDVASAHGFEGEYEGNDLNWPYSGHFIPGQPSYSETVAAKYYARGIMMHLGMDVTTSQFYYSNQEQPVQIVHTIQNLCTIMAGAEPVSLPVEIQSEATDIRSYSFSLPNGDKLIALWTDGVAVDEDPGVKANLALHGFNSQEVMGIDILEGFQQPIVTSSENGNLAIKNLLIRDYPMILLIYTKLSSSITCSASKLEITEGESITVSGATSPALQNKTVTLTYKNPDESTLTRTVTTGGNGTYSDTYKPDAAGLWSVTTSWEGDLQHEGASSSEVHFNVNSSFIGGPGWIDDIAIFGGIGLIAIASLILILRKVSARNL